MHEAGGDCACYAPGAVGGRAGRRESGPTTCLKRCADCFRAAMRSCMLLDPAATPCVGYDTDSE